MSSAAQEISRDDRRRVVETLMEWGARERTGNRELFAALDDLAGRVASRSAAAGPTPERQPGRAASSAAGRPPHGARARAEPSFADAPRLPWLAAAALVVLGVAVLLGWRAVAAGATAVPVTVVGAGEPGAAIRVAAVRDGLTVTEASAVAGSAVELALAPGRYDLFVDGRFSGVGVVMPRDAAGVDGVPYPLTPAAARAAAALPDEDHR